MELSRETLENYQKNLWCLREVTGKLLGHMKGHGFSFRAAITGKNGVFSKEKLRALVEELLAGWEENLRDGLYPDRPGGESPAEHYLMARRELYGLYLYLAMRCSLCEGAYALTGGGEGKERADFAYLLEQARRFSRAWCVVAGPGGAKTNEPFEGFDAYFGFHLYLVLTDPESLNPDRALTPYGKLPARDPAALTNEGSMKRIYCKRPAPPPAAEKPAQAPAPEEPAEECGCDEEYADYGGDYDPAEEDDWDMVEKPLGDEFPGGDLDAQREEYERADWLASLALRFEGREEYLAACKRFAALYRQTPAEVLRGFHEELEEIVNLYLLRHGQTVLTDTDKTLDVYSRVFDGPCRQAARYAGGLQWEIL